METVVRFEKVTKRYGKVEAVRELDLDIQSGQFITLLGPSGCGKSTTLRMLGGFEIPDAGRILLSGLDITRLPPYRRDVNMVFQDYALFPHMSVSGNVAFGLELKGLSKTAIGPRVQELLALVQLEAMADRGPHQLSGGQRQRVALIRALAPDPTVLLLDEPLGALDAKLRSQMQIELKALQRRTGKTFLFVTHDQEEALTMSDVVIVMNKGRIEQAGTPSDLYNQPRSRFVAEFIGESNFLECRVLGSAGNVAELDWNGRPIRASMNGAQHPAGSRVSVALRPENVRCSVDEPASEMRIQGRVLQRIFKGSRTTIVVDTVGGGSVIATMDSSIAEDLPGDRVWLGWSPSRAVVLRD